MIAVEDRLARPTPGRVSVVRLATVASERCEMTQREIGLACGVTPFAVSKMLRRAATDRRFRRLIATAPLGLQTRPHMNDAHS